MVFREFGDIQEAIEEFRAARRFARKAGDLDRESDVSASLGVALVMAGQTQRGLSVLDELLGRSSGVPAGRILIRRVNAFYVLGRNAEALRDAHAAVGLLSGAGDLVWEARAVHWRAAINLAVGDIERADRDYALAETLYAAMWPATGVRVRAPGTRSSSPRPWRPSHRARPPRPCPDPVRSAGDLRGRPVRQQVHGAAGGWPGPGCPARGRRGGGHGSRGTTARRPGAPSCCIPPPWPLPRPATSAWRRIAAPKPCGCSAASNAHGGRRAPSWSCCSAGSPRVKDRSAALLQAARRVTARLDELDPARAIDAHLLTGRLALARGRRDEAARHLRIAADARHRGQLRTRSAGWLAQATWCRGGRALARHAGRVRPRPGPARPAPAHARRHRAAHAGHRQRRGAGGNGVAARGTPGGSPGCSWNGASAGAARCSG